MKKYSLVKEEKDHFVIGHPKDGEFKVAKKGITKALQKKIQSLPKGYSGKGKTPEDQIVKPVSYDVEQNDNADYPTEAVQAQEQQDQLNPFFNMGMIKNAGKEIYGLGKEAVSEGSDYLNKQTYGIPQEKPNKNEDIKKASYEPLFEGNKVIDGPPQPQQPAQPQQAPPQQQPVQPQQAVPVATNPYSGYAAQANRAIDIGTEGSRQAMEEKNRLLQEDAKIREKQFNDHQAHINDWSNEQQALTNDFNNFKLDPKAVWHKADTPNKVMAGISILLSGIGQGLSGSGHNSAMDVLNRTMDADLDAQKAELGKKHNLLSLNLQKYGNLQTAYAQTKAQQLASLQSELQRVENTASDAQVRSRAGQAKAAVSLEAGKMGQQVAQDKFWRGVATGETPLRPQDVNLIPESHKELKESAVIIPGEQRLHFAKDKETAKVANDAIRSASDLDRALTEASNFQQTYGDSWEARNPKSAVSKEGKRLQDLLQIKLGNYLEINGKTMDPTKKAEMSNIAGDPTSFFQQDTKNSYENIHNIMQDTLDSTLTNTTPTYNAPKLRQLEKQAKAHK